MLSQVEHEKSYKKKYRRHDLKAFADDKIVAKMMGLFYEQLESLLGKGGNTDS